MRFSAFILFTSWLAAAPAPALAQPEQAAALPAAGQEPSANEPAAKPAASPGARRVEWDFAWRGWDGLHYSLHTYHPRGFNLTDDEQAPAFPSLFTDRMAWSGKIGGRVDLDAAFFVSSGGSEPVPNQVELRRWRFFASGDAIVLVPFSYSVNVMAVDNYHFVLDDVWLEFRRIPYLGTLRVGAFIPAMSLEASGSSRDATFMEWGTPVNALAPRISSGWQLRRPFLDDRATWSLGQFAQSLGTDVGDATSDFIRLIGRLTWLPLYETPADAPDSKRLLHLGLDLNYLRSGNAQIRYRSRPEGNAAPFLADTGNVNAQDMKSIGLEAAWVDGPWSVQGEFLGNFVSGDSGEFFYGLYGYGSYFWTGESREYDTSRGVFGRLRPRRNLSFCGEGWGALETGFRLSYLDLESGPVNGGKLLTLTAGLNWYLHSHSKLRFNYVYAHANGGPQPGDLNIFETRFEFDF